MAAPILRTWAIVSLRFFLIHEVLRNFNNFICNFLNLLLNLSQVFRVAHIIFKTCKKTFRTCAICKTNQITHSLRNYSSGWKIIANKRAHLLIHRGIGVRVCSTHWPCGIINANGDASERWNHLFRGASSRVSFSSAISEIFSSSRTSANASVTGAIRLDEYRNYFIANARRHSIIFVIIEHLS